MLLLGPREKDHDLYVDVTFNEEAAVKDSRAMKIVEIRDQLESLLDETKEIMNAEKATFDALSRGRQDSKRGQEGKADTKILNDACDSLREAVDYLGTIG